jgi:hypothetical protein
MMKSHEAIQTAINGNTIEHAKALHLSSSSVHKWQEPSTDFTDSGSYNPLDRILTIENTALRLGTPREKALAPLYCHAQHHHHACFPIPSIKPCNKALSQGLLKTIEDFSELTRDSSAALEDGIVTKREMRDIERDGWELIRVVAEFIVSCQEAVK